VFQGQRCLEGCKTGIRGANRGKNGAPFAIRVQPIKSRRGGKLAEQAFAKRGGAVWAAARSAVRPNSAKTPEGRAFARCLCPVSIRRAELSARTSQRTRSQRARPKGGAKRSEQAKRRERVRASAGMVGQDCPVCFLKCPEKDGEGARGLRARQGEQSRAGVHWYAGASAPSPWYLLSVETWFFFWQMANPNWARVTGEPARVSPSAIATVKEQARARRGNWLRAPPARERSEPDEATRTE
jgi:hypothetical protein